MKINSSRLSTKNLAALVQRIIALCHSGKYPVVKNHALVAALEEEYQAYDAVYTKQTTSGKGPLIASADEARDRAFASLKGYLKGYAGLLTLPNAADAELLYGIFEEFGLDIDRLNYAEESAQMLKLLEALETAEHQTRLEKLHAKTAFEELKAAQMAFESLYAEQTAANAELRNQPSASGLRRRLERTLRAFIDLLGAMRNVNGWELLYADVNETVKAATITYKNDPKKKDKTAAHDE